ncbi:unnamed protein product [Rotaria magnacalcarata]|uniref:Transposase n=1 Tax=Rotaria magnacalcarata TaxID=392030 RepID=A0A816F1E3_9BILA|nr:unnamed protein product [Rotaria magnacalcarata]CAF1653682.1 unnamed protein product [Rotaria magnacalcarata]CAF4056036.1 unnamed protein product [Rotaria magnacalcarata]CAF4062049.1 unnamed protein product [Rotaria magnacalcarata]
MCAATTNLFPQNKTDIERLIEQNSTSISYEKPKETTRISKCWSNFSQIYVANIKQNFVICDDCKSILVYKSSTGSGCMLAHSRSCQSTKNKSDLPSQQRKINHYYKSPSNKQNQIPKRIKDAITSSCVEFVAQDSRSFKLLEGSGFVHLAKQLFDTGRLLSSTTNIEIEDLLPDPTTISRNIDQMYGYYKEQLIKLCQSMDSFCVTVDFWTESYTGLSYCGLSLNHIDPTFYSQSFLLGCFPYEMENKRALTIRSFVEDILNDFSLKLNEEKFIMSDNEPTMKCTFNLNCKRIDCSDHYINKQLQHAFTSPMIDGEDVNCELAQELFVDVKQIVSNTCFSGAYTMLVVFQDVYDELGKILDSKLFTTYSRVDEDRLRDICEFLFPFDTVIQTLSDSKRPTLHGVVPLIQFLINKCNINNDDKEGLKQLKAFLGKRLDEKWQLSDEHLIATLVHPNLKHFHMSPHLKERAIFLLKQEILKRQEDLSSTCPLAPTNSSVISVSPSSKSCSSITSISNTNSLSTRKKLLLEIFDKQSEVPAKSAVETELEKYLTSTSVLENEEDDDILSYWRQHQHVFPLIASIARVVLAIPASNTSVERLFSSCKNAITDKRTKLGGEKLNKLMFLQKNKNMLKEKYRTNCNETNIYQDPKRKHNSIISNSEPTKKKLKPHDLINNNHNDNEHLVNIESEDDVQQIIY